MIRYPGTVSHKASAQGSLSWLREKLPSPVVGTETQQGLSSSVCHFFLWMSYLLFFLIGQLLRIFSLNRGFKDLSFWKRMIPLKLLCSSHFSYKAFSPVEQLHYCYYPITVTVLPLVWQKQECDQLFSKNKTCFSAWGFLIMLREREPLLSKQLNQLLWWIGY